jgi:FixJ family two-component response regulator
LPGRSGLDFQRDLSAANIHVPIIFITGYGGFPMSVQAIKAGAIKPFRDQDLLDAIQPWPRARLRVVGERTRGPVRSTWAFVGHGHGK